MTCKFREKIRGPVTDPSFFYLFFLNKSNNLWNKNPQVQISPVANANMPPTTANTQKAINAATTKIDIKTINNTIYLSSFIKKFLIK